jgi:hypothetical protein
MINNKKSIIFGFVRCQRKMLFLFLDFVVLYYDYKRLHNMTTGSEQNKGEEKSDT